ncbi:MAG: hypothetical protein ACK2VD_00735 [Anaerolineae bacterium]|jgi:hypothetical protein
MRYEITVKGTLDAKWSDWFSGMAVAVDALEDGRSLTRLTGQVSDQAALRGMLIKLWDLNLTLISVTCAEAQEESDDTELHVTSG